jgi:uncharacterized protein YjbI with pentapeptide repeats
MNEHVAPQSRKLRFDLHGAFIRRVDLSNTILVDANLAGADAAHASFRGSDFQNANLDGAILRGADLSEARNLTETQLRRAVIDETTLLPDYINRSELGL